MSRIISRQHASAIPRTHQYFERRPCCGWIPTTPRCRRRLASPRRIFLGFVVDWLSIFIRLITETTSNKTKNMKFLHLASVLLLPSGVVSFTSSTTATNGVSTSLNAADDGGMSAFDAQMAALRAPIAPPPVNYSYQTPPPPPLHVVGTTCLLHGMGWHGLR